MPPNDNILGVGDKDGQLQFIGEMCYQYQVGGRHFTSLCYKEE
jgi:hypothetical protein